MNLKDLLALTEEDVLNGALPLNKILQNSLYYPSSWFDGGVVKYCNENFRDKDINSFVYGYFHTGTFLTAEKHQYLIRYPHLTARS